MDLETRAIPAMEIRASGDGSVVVEGYAAVFNQPTNIADIFIERIAPGAFRSALQRGDDVEFLINHGGLPLARSTAGNLTLKEDSHGLHMRAVLDPADPDVQRIVPKMRAKMLGEMSFAFRATEQDWETPADGLDVRTIKDCMLFDVSIVNRGAYPQTEIALRSRDEAREQAEREQQDAERKQHNQSGYLKRKADAEHRFRNI